MERLSAVIIAFNEENNIARCINSLKNITAEIIIVDSFSTDNTAKIARDLGANVIQKKWEGYSAAKNTGDNAATSHYIISLDADEAVSKTLENSILNQLKLGLNGTYSFNRLTNYCGTWIKGSGWYPDKKIRIFPKSNCYWEGSIHEYLVQKTPQKNTHLKGDLLHYSYTSAVQHRQKADKYSVLKAAEMHEKGRKSSKLKAFFSAIFRFISMYIFKYGFIDGRAGFQIALISAKSNYFKYTELLRLNQSAKIK
jgi:glycosyltransferase involved in cell wall biosynthesis